jgi:hypothetical protein
MVFSLTYADIEFRVELELQEHPSLQGQGEFPIKMETELRQKVLDGSWGLYHLFVSSTKGELTQGHYHSYLPLPHDSEHCLEVLEAFLEEDQALDWLIHAFERLEEQRAKPAWA